MMARKLVSVFSQLPVSRAVCVTACDATRKLLDANRAATYAQIGDDRIIQHYLAECASRFYVDIGCNHPVKLSNTYLLYQQGWRGLCVDGNPELIRLFRRARPRDDVKCVAVGERNGQGRFFISTDPALSHLADTAGALDRGNEGQEYPVEVTTAGELFAEHDVPHRFGLLSIDVEGADFAVLKSFDIEEYRPLLVVIECHGLSLLSCADNPTVGYMLNADYDLVGFNVCNAFFLDGRRR